MTDFTDYYQVLVDVDAILSAALTSLVRHGTNLPATEFSFDRMPIMDVRPATATPALNSLPDGYYNEVEVEVEFGASHLSSKDKAAKIVLDLVNQGQVALKANPRYNSAWDSLILGPVEFVTAESPKEGAFVASAIMRVTINMYAG